MSSMKQTNTEAEVKMDVYISKLKGKDIFWNIEPTNGWKVLFKVIKRK